LKIRGDIPKSRYTSGINDISGKFATGINETGGKFATSFASVDAGGKFTTSVKFAAGGNETGGKSGKWYIQGFGGN
jgi:hypothetical protein